MEKLKWKTCNRIIDTSRKPIKGVTGIFLKNPYKQCYDINEKQNATLIWDCGCCAYDAQVEDMMEDCDNMSDLNDMARDMSFGPYETNCKERCGGWDSQRHYKRVSLCLDCLQKVIPNFDPRKCEYFSLHYLYATGIYQEIGRNMCEEVIELMNK